jgi:hypothetical protein
MYENKTNEEKRPEDCRRRSPRSPPHERERRKIVYMHGFQKTQTTRIRKERVEKKLWKSLQIP